MATVAIIGTCDTKLQELLFLRDRIQEHAGVETVLIDVGRHQVQHPAISVAQAALLSQYGGEESADGLTRGQFIEFASRCATPAVRELLAGGSIHGIVSAGGSGNTSLTAAVMRNALPIGFPKLIVSTMASGDTGPIVGETDIALMYSVVDIAGMNSLLQDILSNAATAIAATSLLYAARQRAREEEDAAGSQLALKRVGITMFGVTTPGANAIRAYLESNYAIETYVFHATGSGGRGMEKLIRGGRLDAVIDLTTTEICDQVIGGVLSAGESRLDAAVETGIPNIVSLGALDMCNFGPMASVPEKFQGRTLLEHNPTVTIMRTSPEECRRIGEFISGKLRKAHRPEQVELWMPKGGISAIAVPGAAFADPDADQALFDAIRHGLKGSGITIVEDERDVNDEGFARDIAEALVSKLGIQKKSL